MSDKKEYNMDTDFDEVAVIANLSVKELRTVSFPEMLRLLGPLVTVKVPEGTQDNINEKKRLDYLLGRSANLYAYLRYLWAAASYERVRLMKIDTDAAEDMLKKKEALYELGSAVKLKYEAVSRMVTVALEDELPDRADHQGRVARMTKSTGTGWDKVT